MCLDCSGVTTENSAISVRFWSDMVIPLYWLPWLLLFVNHCRHWVGNQQTCCFRKLLQWCHSPCCVPFWRLVNEGCDCFFVVAGIIVRASSVMTDWGVVVVSLEAVLTCIVKCGNCMRPCRVSMTTLLFLIKCNPTFGLVNLFNTPKRSAKILSPISN